MLWLAQATPSQSSATAGTTASTRNQAGQASTLRCKRFREEGADMGLYKMDE